MKTFFKALIVAAALMVAAPIAANAATACKMTDTQFYAEAGKFNPKVFVASASAQATLVNRINKARAENGDPPFVVDKLIIGIFQYKGQTYAGTAMFKDHCVVPNSVKVFPLDQFISFLETLGIGMDDFVSQGGA